MHKNNQVYYLLVEIQDTVCRSFLFLNNDLQDSYAKLAESVSQQ